MHWNIHQTYKVQNINNLFLYFCFQRLLDRGLTAECHSSNINPAPWCYSRSFNNPIMSFAAVCQADMEKSPDRAPPHVDKQEVYSPLNPTFLTELIVSISRFRFETLQNCLFSSFQSQQFCLQLSRLGWDFRNTLAKTKTVWWPYHWYFHQTHIHCITSSSYECCVFVSVDVCVCW